LGEIWGFSPLIFVRGHFYEIGIAALLFRAKPRHVEHFRKFRFADGKSQLGKKKKKHAQNIRSTVHKSTVHRTGDKIVTCCTVTNIKHINCSTGEKGLGPLPKNFLSILHKMVHFGAFYVYDGVLGWSSQRGPGTEPRGQRPNLKALKQLCT